MILFILYTKVWHCLTIDSVNFEGKFEKITESLRVCEEPFFTKEFRYFSPYFTHVKPSWAQHTSHSKPHNEITPW